MFRRSCSILFFTPFLLWFSLEAISTPRFVTAALRNIHGTADMVCTMGSDLSSYCSQQVSSFRSLGISGAVKNRTLARRCSNNLTSQQTLALISDIQKAFITYAAAHNTVASDDLMVRILEKIGSQVGEHEESNQRTKHYSQEQTALCKALLVAYLHALESNSPVFLTSDLSHFHPWVKGLRTVYEWVETDTEAGEIVAAFFEKHVLELFAHNAQATRFILGFMWRPYAARAERILLHNVFMCNALNANEYYLFLRECVDRACSSDTVSRDVLQAVHMYITKIDFVRGHLLLSSSELHKNGMYRDFFNEHRAEYKKLYMPSYARKGHLSEAFLMAQYALLMPEGESCGELMASIENAADKGTAVDVMRHQHDLVREDVYHPLMHDESLKKYIDHVYMQKKRLEDEGYIVFIHAQNGRLYFPVWCYNKICSLQGDEYAATDYFSYIRIPAEYDRTVDPVYTDYIFANASLTANLAVPFESSLWFALSNRNANGTIHLTVRDAFDAAGVSRSIYKKYEKRIVALEQQYDAMTRYGSLWLIAIPKVDVNSSVTVTRACGDVINVLVRNAKTGKVRRTKKPKTVAFALCAKDGYSIDTMHYDEDVMDPIFIIPLENGEYGLSYPHNKIVRVCTEHDAQKSDLWNAFEQERKALFEDIARDL